MTYVINGFGNHTISLSHLIPLQCVWLLTQEHNYPRNSRVLIIYFQISSSLGSIINKGWFKAGYLYISLHGQCLWEHFSTYKPHYLHPFPCSPIWVQFVSSNHYFHPMRSVNKRLWCSPQHPGVNKGNIGDIYIWVLLNSYSIEMKELWNVQ